MEAERMKVLAIFLVTTIFLGFGLASGESPQREKLRARAVIQGGPESGISGEVIFTETSSGITPIVKIVAKIKGLEPNSVHGFHIHENGTCSPDFAAAGGHFDPGPFGKSDPDANHPFHMGDMPNLKANSKGEAEIETMTNRISLSPGPLSLFDSNGSAVIIHQNEDKGSTGVKDGSGGPRIACGVIARNE
jgi:Cu-Zn family superoxide dismutase